MTFYDLANVFARIVLKIVARYEIIGLENVPVEGPFIIVANHISWLDPPMLGAMLPRPIRFMAKEELFRNPIVGWVVSHYQAFPVRRGENDRAALRAAMEILRDGGVLGMFPEGTRSRNGKLQAGRPGAALLALRSGAPVLPIGITGTQDVFRFPNVFLRPKFKVVIGRPFQLTRDGTNEGDLMSMCDALMLRIAALLPEEYRGVYGTRANESGAS